VSHPESVNGNGGSGLYPPIAPFSEQFLPVSHQHRLYVEQSGNPSGVPVLFLHGGPGSQVRADHRRYFDPTFYRAVLFDQRGCGRSTPAGCVEENTTWHLVADIEAIRRTLGVNKWVLFGGSWGSTLALAYAITYPQHVAGMVLRGVFLASHAELDWYVHGLRRFIPAAWERFENGLGSDIVQGYQRDVTQADAAHARSAAQRWADYEVNVMAIGESSVPTGGAVDESALLGRVTIQLHYLAADCFLTEGQLLRGVGSVAAPTIIVQGRTDMVCPPVTAYALNATLPNSQLRIIEQAGHAALAPRLAGALRDAADDMRDLVAGAM